MKQPPQEETQKERRLVTILFADLSGFTALSEGLDPEELSDALNVCFEILNRIITGHGGTIHKYEGDSVLAIFGLPHAHEDDPERGVKAALEMMERIPEINKALSTKLNTPCDLGLHMGINLGTVFAGAIGSKEKKEYTIIGEAVNMASRLMNAADNGEIFVSARVFRQTRYLFEYESLKPIQVKGISKPVHVFKPLEVKDKPDPKRGIKGFQSVMVGRDKEFALLCKKVQDLYKKKKGGVVFVLGAAGIGKSRLYDELKKHTIAEKMSINIIEGRCLSYGEMITYFPVLEVLKKLFGISDPDSMDTIKEKILSTCLELLPGKNKEVAPYILYLFSIPVPQEFKEKVKHLDAEGLNLQISVALKDLLKAAAKKSPLLMVIEDYHWIDSASLDLLRFIFDTSDDDPLLLLCLSRIERESEGHNVKKFFRENLGDSFAEIELRMLSNEASRQLTENILKLSGLTPNVQKQMLAKAEGNPLFLEEIIRSLIDEGFLVYESGIWKASEDLTIAGIPDSIQEIIATRIDLLEPDLKVVLQKAAVIGRSFLVPLLERLTKVDSLMMSVHLATLEELEYIRLLTKEPELEYIFKHPMVREVTYNSLPKKNRREMHGQVAKLIEKLLSERIDEFTELLAHHYTNSDDQDMAIEWLEKAGFHAKERYANEEAIKYFEKVVSVINGSAKATDHYKCIQLKTYEALGDIHAIRGDYDKAIEAFTAITKQNKDTIMSVRAQRKSARVYWHQSNLIDALDTLDKALKELSGDSVDSLIEQAEIYLLQGAVYEVQGAIGDAQKAAEKALSIVEKVGMNDRVKKIRATVYSSLGAVFRNHSDYGKAIEMYEQSKVLLEELNDKQVMGNVTYLLGIVYHMKGDSKKAIDLNEQSLAILEQIGDKKNIGRTCNNLGIMYSHLDQSQKSLDFHRKSLRISLEIGDKRGEGMAYSNLAQFHLGKGEHDQAHEFFQKYLKIAEHIGDKTNISAALGNLAILYIHSKEFDKAEEYLLRAVKIFKQLGNKQMLITAYNHLANVKRLKGESFEEALDYLDKGWALVNEIGSKSDMAECAFAYAQIYAVMQDIEKAEEYMEQAARLMTELGRVALLNDSYEKYAKILKDIGEIKLAALYNKKAKALDKKSK